MLKGKTLVELAQAVQNTSALKADIVAPSNKMALTVVDHTPLLSIPEVDITNAPVTPHALRQITEFADIPSKYVERMLAKAPTLLEANVNHWFNAEPSLRLARGIRNSAGNQVNIRAFMSNRYRRIEHDQMLAAILPELQSQNLRVVSSELTETRMYLKVEFPGMQGETRKGDIVTYGFILKNSEIGLGACDLGPYITRKVCDNGLIVPKDVDDARMRKTHLGRALEEGVDYYTDETIRADDTALMLKVRDTIRAYQDPVRWEAVLTKLRRTTEGGNAADPIATVERIGATLLLPKPEQNSVLANFLSGNDHTQWGLVNAITAVANNSESYDRAVELEALGGRVLSLAPTEWRELAKAA